MSEQASQTDNIEHLDLSMTFQNGCRQLKQLNSHIIYRSPNNPTIKCDVSFLTNFWGMEPNFVSLRWQL